MSTKTDKPPDEKTTQTQAPATPPAPPATPPAPSAAPATAAAPPAPPPPAPPAAPPAPRPARQARTIADVAAEPPKDKTVKDATRVTRKVLRKFGIDLKKGDDVDAVAEEFRSKQEKRKGEKKDLEAKAAIAAEAETNAKATLDYELATLDEETRAKAKLFLGEGTAVKQLGRLVDLKRSGLVKATAAPAAPATTTTTGAPATPPAAPPAAPPGKAPVAPPATTAPTTQGPGASTAQPPDIKAEIKRLEVAGRSGDKRSALLASIAKAENKRVLYTDDHRPKPE